jgi:hypothetical protein
VNGWQFNGAVAGSYVRAFPRGASADISSRFHAKGNGFWAVYDNTNTVSRVYVDNDIVAISPQFDFSMVAPRNMGIESAGNGTIRTTGGGANMNVRSEAGDVVLVAAGLGSNVSLGAGRDLDFTAVRAAGFNTPSLAIGSGAIPEPTSPRLLFEVVSTSKAMAGARMTTAERDLVAWDITDAGAEIYNTTLQKKQIWTSALAWETITSAV